MKYEIKNRYGDIVSFEQLEPGHWRVIKTENFFGSQVIGDAPNYVAADFVSGGPYIAVGSHLNGYISDLPSTEAVTKIVLPMDVENGFDLFTETL